MRQWFSALMFTWLCWRLLILTLYHYIIVALSHFYIISSTAGSSYGWKSETITTAAASAVEVLPLKGELEGVFETN